ncbi:hypothetical protein GCM10028806_28630 [Spirosoma terrae]|uniref:Uncharacterized protein n=1 Tax=Spirosoma terrae TaxID=1968276 RepID=A0A6L9L9D4_9BACT|nr:hypothetical protein [Spirosoma terrae]NDU97176.1 hypothetical protein [Spirosoma terrae]
MTSENEKSSFIDTLLKNNFIRIIGTLTAFLASVVGIFLAIPSFVGNTPKIEVRLQESEILTQKSNVKGLVSHYTYNGDTVSSLWRCRIEVANTGKKTIIGRGKHSDLLDDKLRIDLNPNFHLVKVEKVPGNSIPIEVDFQEHELNFKFDQWLVDEKIEIIGYFINNKALSSFAIPVNQKRSIENGEIIVVDKQNTTKSKEVFIDTFDPPIPLIARSLSVILLLAELAFMILFILSSSFKSTISFWRWKRIYYKSYIDILTKNPELIPKSFVEKFPYRDKFSKDEKALMIVSFNREIEKKFKIPVPPSVSPEHRSLSFLIKSLIVCFFILAAMGATFLCIIKY